MTGFTRAGRWRCAAAALMFSLLAIGCQHGRRAAAPPAEPKVEVLEESWENGTPRLRREVVRDAEGQAIDHGRYERWHRNGRREYEATFVLGKKHGTTTRYHQNGQAWMQENYVMGKKEGVAHTWDEDGNLRKEEHYADGRPTGTWTVWNPKGEVKAQQRWDEIMNPPEP